MSATRLFKPRAEMAGFGLKVRECLMASWLSLVWTTHQLLIQCESVVRVRVHIGTQCQLTGNQSGSERPSIELVE